ncbi:MAG TPA: sulfate ABC transporter substrate-binding protein, partial [Leptolyngbyaceae cyanobacterium M33_DOE_097]|nr:sulfate ABC transporter substrate-binding protein [Leptolyngbyaceae cyanobacterium M33_DOE_097]
MKRWHSLLNAWEQIANSMAQRLKLTSLKGFVSLFMLGALLSVVVAACSSNPASTDANVPG